MGLAQRIARRHPTFVVQELALPGITNEELAYLSVGAYHRAGFMRRVQKATTQLIIEQRSAAGRLAERADAYGLDRTRPAGELLDPGYLGEVSFSVDSSKEFADPVAVKTAGHVFTARMLYPYYDDTDSERRHLKSAIMTHRDDIARWHAAFGRVNRIVLELYLVRDGQIWKIFALVPAVQPAPMLVG